MTKLIIANVENKITVWKVDKKIDRRQKKGFKQKLKLA